MIGPARGDACRPVPSSTPEGSVSGVVAAVQTAPFGRASVLASPSMAGTLRKSGLAADARSPDHALSTPSVTSAAPKDLVEKRVAVLKAGHSNAVSETTWQLGARPADTNAPTADEIEIKKRFGPGAQIISSPQRQKERKFYFEDLPPDLQNVLRAQLRQPGAVSAVIESPGGFLIYVCKDKTATALTVACLSLPKRSYEQWLAQYGKGIP